MSKLSFIEFKYGALPRKLSRKPTQLSINKERPNSNVSSRTYQQNIEEMKWVFDKFDTNKDGKISKEEYKSALKVMGKGVAETEMGKAFTAIETDGGGFIDYKEFVQMMHNMGEEINGGDEDGRERCSLEACRKMIRGVDVDGDGLIDIIEFIIMMTRTMEHSQ